MKSLETNVPLASCCELREETAEAEESGDVTPQNKVKPAREGHWWLDKQLVDKLPLNIRKGKMYPERTVMCSQMFQSRNKNLMCVCVTALCEACRETHISRGLLSHVTRYLPKIPSILPVDSAYWLAQRCSLILLFVSSICKILNSMCCGVM